MNPIMLHTSLILTAAAVTLILMLISKLAVAQDDQQCNEYRFDIPFFPGSSCKDIYNKNLQSRNKPGYYWILDGPSRVYCGMNYTGSSCEDVYNDNIAVRNKSGYYRISNTWTYCNMTAIASGDVLPSCAGVGGGWKKIASFNITAGDSCPSPWVKSSYNNVSFCIPAITTGGCHSVGYSTNGMSYQRVCGRASAYQKGSPDAFVYSQSYGIDSYYVEGLSITRGSPREHIWTYAVGVTDSGNNPCCNCPCATVSGSDPPSFVGSHYYCESGASSTYDVNAYYFSDVLWDGAGCSAGNSCCSDRNQPWFYRQLSETTQDDIEVRSCTGANIGFDNGAILITNLELYIQ